MQRVMAGRVLALLLGAIAVAGMASAQDVSLIFNNTGYIPFFSADDDSDYEEYHGYGLLVDFFDAFEQAFPEHHIIRIAVPRLRGDAMVEAGEADGYALHSPLFMGEGPSDLVFSETVWHSADIIYVRSDHPSCYANAGELEGVELGVVRGYGYGPLDPGLESGAIHGVAVNKHVQLYKMLLSGRVEAIVDNMHVLPFNMKESGLDASLVKPCLPAVYEFDLAVLAHRSRQTFLDDLNTFIARIREDGTMTALERKWLGTVPPVPDIPEGGE